MTGEAKVFYAVLATALVLLGLVALVSDSGSDCWTEHSTEHEAITHCEAH